MTYRAEKKYNGHVSVRSYIIEEAVKRKENLTIEHDGGAMTIPLTMLKDPFQMHTKEMQSQFSDATYTLFDFRWRPEVENQLKLF